MNNLSKKSVCIITSILLLAFSFCTKKNVAGPQGDPGEPGKMGNSTQSSVTFSLSAATWSFNGADYTNDVYVQKITEAVVNYGEVKVFMKVGDQWWSLPYAVGDEFMQMSFKRENIRLKYSEIHDGPPPAPGSLTFRAVVIEQVQ